MGKLNLGVPLVFCVKLQIPALINVNLLNYSLNAGIEQYVVYSQLYVENADIPLMNQ